MRRLAVIVVLFIATFGRRAAADTQAIAVLETAAPDMPEAASAVTRQLYATVARLGYRAVPEAIAARLLLQRGPRYLAPEDLVAIAHEASAERAVQVTLTPRDDRYVATLVTASAEGGEPRRATEVADAATLEATVDRLARAALPAAAAEPRDALQGDAGTSVRLALQTEGAFGLSEHFFYNHFAGARLDYAFTPDFAMGAYAAYANLKGRDGRTANVLSYLQLEYRLALSDSSRVRVPLRFAAGYLPKNGPLLRLAAGPSFPLGRSTRLGFDLLAPTFIIVHDRTVVSLDVAAELCFEL